MVLGSPEFKSSATLVNSQLVRLLPVAILNHIEFELLVHYPGKGERIYEHLSIYLFIYLFIYVSISRAQSDPKRTELVYIP